MTPLSPTAQGRLSTSEQKPAHSIQGTRRGGEAERCYLTVCMVLVAVMSAILVWIAPAEHDFLDYWEHLAAIKQLMLHPLHPLHPQYGTHDASRQYMPWFLLLALFGRFFHWSPFTVLTFGSIVTIILSLIGIRLFFREYFKNPWAPLAGLISLFFMWGRPWIWSSFYSLRSFLLTAAYPASFAFAITFVIWWMGLRALRSKSLRSRDIAVITGMLALGLLVHQLSGLFAVAGLICFLLGDRSRVWPRKFILFGTIVVAGAAVHFWPYFDPWQITNENQLWNSQWTSIPAQKFYRASDVLLCIGPSILGVIPLAWFARRRAYLGTVFVFSGGVVGYGVGGLLHNPVSHRLLIVMILGLQIATAWLLLVVFGVLDFPEWEFIEKWRRPLRAIAGVAVMSVILLQVGVVTAEMVDLEVPNSAFAHLPIRHRIEIKRALQQISMYLSPQSIAMASREASMVLPVFNGRVVSVYRASPLVPSDSDRARDADRFFWPTTSKAERSAIIARYRITHVFYWLDDFASHSPPGFLEEITEQTERVGDFVLVKINRPQS
jgi:hypothetical protein